MRPMPLLAGFVFAAAATAALAQGGVPPPANMHSTMPPGSASSVSNSIGPGPTLDGPAGSAAAAGMRPLQGVGTDAAVTHPPGSVRGTSAAATPAGPKAGMRGSQAGAEIGKMPDSYPVCRSRGQDRCRVR